MSKAIYSNYLNCKFKIKAFTLIELSIVLIIIGLLVAGITGGASLIQSAKLRSFASEIRNYRTQFNAFRVANDRWPGDYDNQGWTGLCLGLGCPGVTSTTGTAQKSPSDVNMTQAVGSGESGVIYRAQPWQDLYLNNIGEFKPNQNSLSSNTFFKQNASTKCGNVPGGCGDVIYPCLKSFDNMCIEFVATYKNYAVNLYPNHYANNVKSDTIWFYLDTNDATSAEYRINKDPRILKKIDEKFDDGKFNGGKLRANCEGTPTEEGTDSATYSVSISEGKKCTHVYYQIVE